MIELQAAFGLQPPELVALTGGGGKSSLLFALGAALSPPVILTTTTRLFSAQLARAPAVWSLEEPAARLEALLARHGRCLVVGRIEGDKALGVPADLPAHLLGQPGVRFVVAEADGSRMRPCKAPAEHEPVVPLGTTLLVPLAGLDALEGPIEARCHRPERVATLTGLSPAEALTAEALAGLLAHPEGGLKGVPPTARVIPFLNKVEGMARLAAARRVAGLALAEPRISQVALGSLKAAEPVIELWRRLTAVVLAAGQSRRMGATKQLLPWGATTVLGQTLRNLAAAGLTDVLVVSGHQADKVESEARAAGARTLFNPNYAAGEMLSSLQAALRALPVATAAVLVAHADQPMLAPDTLERLLTAFRQGTGELIAPTFKGQRGNPVLFGRAFFAELLALPAGGAPRDVVRRHATELALVEVDDEAVLHDLDRPDEYARWRPAGP
ncbi:MAG: selenium cofactor biosynthesis protein YqeC [Candidatus Promineifilaceae bacterium]